MSTKQLELILIKDQSSRLVVIPDVTFEVSENSLTVCIDNSNYRSFISWAKTMIENEMEERKVSFKELDFDDDDSEDDSEESKDDSEDKKSEN